MKLNRKYSMYQHGESIEVKGHIFYRVPKFKYLRILTLRKAEIWRKIQMANKCHYVTGKI